MVSSTLRIRHPSVAWLGPPWGGFLAMQKFTMKLWTIAAGAAAATTLAAPPALAHPEEDRQSTSELQSLMRISYAVLCLKIKIDAHLYFVSRQTTTHNRPITNTK